MAKPCIRCGDCEVICPVHLKPQLLHASIEAENWKQTQRLNLDACLFCNACTAACPSHIELNHEFKTAHSTLNNIKEKNEQSLEAKKRFEAKSSRLARKERLQAAQRAEKLLKASTQDKKAAIAAALERVKRKYENV